jgi:hypothetical protein
LPVFQRKIPPGSRPCLFHSRNSLLDFALGNISPANCGQVISPFCGRAVMALTPIGKDNVSLFIHK